VKKLAQLWIHLFLV